MILSILDTKKKKSYIIAVVITLMFGFIYEQFSHDVYSNYMMFAFVIPLIGYILHLITKIDSEVYDCGIVTITLYSILKGVFEIIGITNKYIIIYLIVGILLTLISLLIKLFKK